MTLVLLFASFEPENVQFRIFREYLSLCFLLLARRGGAEVAGWTVDRTIRVRFPAFPHRMWAL